MKWALIQNLLCYRPVTVVSVLAGVIVAGRSCQPAAVAAAVVSIYAADCAYTSRW